MADTASLQTTDNIDCQNLYHVFDEIVDATQRSTAAKANGVQVPDLKRFADWGVRMRREVTNAIRPVWDIVNIDPKKFPLQPQTDVIVKQNRYINHLTGIAATLRELVVHMDSSKNRNGLTPNDGRRLLEGCDEWDNYIKDVITPDPEPDLPGTDRQLAADDQTGANA